MLYAPCTLLLAYHTRYAVSSINALVIQIIIGLEEAAADNQQSDAARDHQEHDNSCERITETLDSLQNTAGCNGCNTAGDTERNQKGSFCIGMQEGIGLLH